MAMLPTEVGPRRAPWGGRGFGGAEARAGATVPRVTREPEKSVKPGVALLTVPARVHLVPPVGRHLAIVSRV